MQVKHVLLYLILGFVVCACRARNDRQHVSIYACLDALISENYAWVFLMILGLKVEINLHLFACYPQFL